MDSWLGAIVFGQLVGSYFGALASINLWTFFLGHYLIIFEPLPDICYNFDSCSGTPVLANLRTFNYICALASGQFMNLYLGVLDLTLHRLLPNALGLKDLWDLPGAHLFGPICGLLTGAFALPYSSNIPLVRTLVFSQFGQLIDLCYSMHLVYNLLINKCFGAPVYGPFTYIYLGVVAHLVSTDLWTFTWTYLLGQFMDSCLVYLFAPIYGHSL